MELRLTTSMNTSELGKIQSSSVNRFTQVIEIFKLDYLREPTDEDTTRLMAQSEERTLGSIGHGKYVMWHGKFYSEGHFSRKLHQRIYGFGIPISDCLDHTMTSMLCKDLYS